MPSSPQEYHDRVLGTSEIRARMRLGDYADGTWMFIATCGTCGRQARVDPAEVLTHPRRHPRIRLRCRDCRHRTARIDPVARLRTQAFVAGMI